MERKEARRAVKQARVQGLEAAREAAASFAASRRSDAPAELEAPLLPGSPYAPKGPDKPPSEGGSLPGEDGRRRDPRSLWHRLRRSLGEGAHACGQAASRESVHQRCGPGPPAAPSPAPSHPRTPGLTVRWEDDSHAYVERVALGGAMQPTPSWNRVHPAQTVIDW